MNCDTVGWFPPETLNAASAEKLPRPRFSICTIVNRPHEYAAMVNSFQAGGFSAASGCEFLYLDNVSGNTYECYSGYNTFLRTARGRYIILCHQDVTLMHAGLIRLNDVIEELYTLDPSWGLFGNAGGYWPGKLASRIDDPYPENQYRGGPLPRRCYSLDENFILVRADANLALSRNLSGFHLYGTELCLVAEGLGYQAYVVDFYLHHASGGKIDRTYKSIRSDMIRKYSSRLRIRLIRSTCSSLVFTPWAPVTMLANTTIGIKISRVINLAFGALSAPHSRSIDSGTGGTGDGLTQ